MRGSDEILDRELSALLDGALPPEREAELRALAESSPEVAARLEALGAVDAALRAVPLPALPADLRARLDARLDASPDADRPAPVAPLQRSRRWLVAGAGSALAAAAALTLVLARQPSVAPLSAPLTSGELARTPVSPGTLEEALSDVSDEELLFAVGVPGDDLELLEDLDLLLVLDALDDGATG